MTPQQKTDREVASVMVSNYWKKHRIAEVFPRLPQDHAPLITSLLGKELDRLVLRAIRIGRKRGSIPKVKLARFTKKTPYPTKS